MSKTLSLLRTSEILPRVVLLHLLVSMEVLPLTVSRRHNLLLDSKSLQHPLVVLSRPQLVGLDTISFLERVFKQLSPKLKPQA